ncbi:MAG: hypothetical protein RLZZ360_240 [Candidatus Parcubacteria bacterium]
MTNVVLAAELAYQIYIKDKGIRALIAWFKAELTLQGIATEERYGAHKDEFLAQHQEHVEGLAKQWRSSRQSVAVAATG